MSTINVTICPTEHDGEWLMVYTLDHTHIIPACDEIRHRLSADCICGPFTDPVKGDDGHISYVHAHHSLDGREIHDR